MNTLLIATTNRGKIREFKELLQGLLLNPVTPNDLNLKLDVVEDGTTYSENAIKKAKAFCEVSGLMTIADDFGLEVDALDGAPGLHSARYHPDPKAGDADRRKMLMETLSEYPHPWKAHFHCAVVIAIPGGQLILGEGGCSGEIITEERGNCGFGYDPIFLLAERGLTMAELGVEEKNRVSHRAKAVQEVLPALRRLADLEL